MACIICNTMDNLVDSVITTDNEGKQVILQLCDEHSDTITPKQARLAFEVRNQISIIVNKASENGLRVEIPTVICEGAVISSISSKSMLVPAQTPVVVQERTMPTSEPKQEITDQRLEAVTMSQIDAIGGSKATIPTVMSDDSRIIVVKRSDALIQKHTKDVVASEISFRNGYDIRDCALCRGSGLIKKSRTEEITCPKCGGSGMF